MAYARNSDPQTAKDAANIVKSNLPFLEGQVYDALQNSANGLTTIDIAEITGLDRVTVSPRIKPLCNKGLVKDSGRRNGRSIVWVTI